MNQYQKISTAIGSTFVASILSSISGAVSKYSKLTGREIGLCLGSVTLLYSICLVLLQCKKGSTDQFQIRKFEFSALNGFVFIGCSNFFFYRAFDLLTYGDLIAVTYSTIFVTTITAEKVKLRQKPNFITCLAAFISFFGLVVFSQPVNLFHSLAAGKLETLEGVISAVISGITTGFYFFNLQFMKNYPTSFHWFAYGLGVFSGAIPSIVIKAGSVSQCLVTARLTAIIACALWSFQSVTSIIGSQLSLPSIMLLLRLVTIVLSYVLQISLLGEAITVSSAIGASAIGCGVVIQVFSMYCRK